MRPSRMLAALGTGLALCSANAAAAAIVTMTYSGYVTGNNSIDKTGVFGPANTLLTGSFTAKFIFDTRNAVGYVDDDPDYPGYGVDVYGTGASSPLRGAWMTINGVTLAFAGDSSRAATSNYDGNYVDHRATVTDRLDERDGDGVGSLYEAGFGLTAEGYGVPYGLDTDLDFDVPDDGYGFGSFYVGRYVFEPYIYGGIERFDLVVASASLVTTHFTQSVVAVPEPAAWAMMLAGFGAVGLTVRRRRAVFARATAPPR